MSKWFHIIIKTVKLKKPGFHSRKHSSIPVELWEREPVPGLTSIQYLFMNFASKLLLIKFVTMYHQVITKFFNCTCVWKSQFQTLIRSCDSPIKTQTLRFFVIIDDTTSMAKVTNG